jgi:DNA polymerase III alpha subunit (gram-positive type)
MNINTAVTLTLDFEFELFFGRRYVWQVGGVISTPTGHLEFEYDISLVKGQGIGQREGLERLLNVIENFKINVIRCHNAGAERSVLQEWCKREGLEMPEILWIDTLSLARKWLPARWSMSQGELLKRFGLDQGGEAHRALPDARGCMLLFTQLMKIRHGLVPMPS